MAAMRGPFARLMPYLLLVFLAGCAARSGRSDLTPRLTAAELKPRLLSLLSRARAGDRGLEVPDEVLAFYERRGFEPFWSETEDDGLLAALAACWSDGLDPRDYHVGSLSHLGVLLSDPALRASASLRADREILRTDGFLALAGDLRFGRLDPRVLDPDWLIVRPRSSSWPELARAGSPQAAVASLEGFRPQHETYRKLKEELVRLRQLAARPMRALRAANLRPGRRSPEVAELRRRLEEEGDLAGGATDPQAFDSGLEAAVRRFQERHGLKPDGRLGRRTLDALFTLPEERARQVRANLERWRWLPRDLGEHFVVVNAAAYETYLVEAGQISLRMPAVVGRRYRQTPALASQITSVVVNPSWVVPRTILVEDILPRIEKDPSYLVTNGLVLGRGQRARPRPVALDGFRWDTLLTDGSPYFVWQPPGPANNLGPLKFVFRNEADVYLHGTPNQGDFKRPERALSSGCIRLAEPFVLAARLMAGTNWDETQLRKLAESGETRRLALPRPVPVYLLYWTVWSDTAGRVHYRPDVYQRDARTAEALHRATGVPW